MSILHPELKSTDEGYQKWRDRIPWTDAEIAYEVHREADTARNEWVRSKLTRAANHLTITGRLCSWTFKAALPGLVKTCSICGRTALYRLGVIGRCAKHKNIPTKGTIWRQEFFKTRDNAFDEWAREREAQLKRNDHKIHKDLSDK